MKTKSKHGDHILKTNLPLADKFTRTEEAWVEENWLEIKALLGSRMPATLRKPLADFVSKHFLSQLTLEQLAQQPNALKCLREMEKISVTRK